MHGVPKKILNNRRPQFVSWFIEDLYKALGTKTLSIAYYPQIDG